jgi:Uma2 family endonuclease
MQIEVTKKLFTVDDYYRMAEAGIIGPEERTELIDGEIIQKSPPGNRHVACVNRANTTFVEAFRQRAIVSVQNPLRLNIYNEPQPDIVVLQPRSDFYESIRFSPEHVFFVVEISDTSPAFDRKVKLARYAEFGVPEVWIEDLKHDLLLVFRELEGKSYKSSLSLRRGDSVSPIAFPDVVLKVEQLLG